MTEKFEYRGNGLVKTSEKARKAITQNKYYDIKKITNSALYGIMLVTAFDQGKTHADMTEYKND